MTPYLPEIIGGAAAGAGIAVMAAALVPAPPNLQATIARLHGQRPASAAPTTGPAALRRWVAVLAERLPSPAADLRVLGQPVERFVLSKLLMALYGLLLPGLLAGVLLILGVGLPVVVPAGVCLLSAAAFFFAPDLVIRSQAAERRAEFRRTVGAYLDLVALERGADGGPADALTRAAAVGEGWAFQALSDTLVTARLSGEPPWVALSGLADRIGVSELADLADVVAIAGDDGAAIATTLAAKAEGLRAQQLAASRAAANAASEKLTLPGVVLAFAFLLLICYPALARILGP